VPQKKENKKNMRKLFAVFATLLPAVIFSGPAAATDHSIYVKGPFKDGPAVTETCLHCHARQGKEVLESIHYLWEGPAPHVVNVPEGTRLGKRNLMNNY
jgi:hypothetical protein